ncbi:divergent polysaccharide deacetylase family protein [uncultured Desulfovibrio sp.]|uniref:divergent polysaccharide deacetylase family protein n=1 Tax=uncultured Desulfovibrio sp. TaxID=167968 RepID=UPI00272C8736|nr:divergent polysaccharide deacetylase family protein [uncultured Desulfovibrio sp.]
MCASDWLGLGGLAWLVCALAFSLWWGEELTAPDTAEENSLAAVSAVEIDAAGQQPTPSVHEREARFTLDRVEALVIQTLPRALPLAHWRREEEPPSGVAETDARRYRIAGPCAPLRLAVALLEKLRAAAAADSSLLPRLAWTDEGVLELRLNGRLSHSFHFPGRERELADLARPLPAAALVLVIDDLGQSLEAAEALAALPFPVTLALWPRASGTGAAANLAGQRGLDCLVHMPMEPLPRADGSRPKPGAGALFTDMSPQALAAALEPALSAVPTALGLNNHMGSRFTGSASASRQLCAQLAGRGFAVLDSLTSPHSRLAEAARAAGLVSVTRAVFLDTNRKTDAILAALDAAAARARSGGFAVAIGHPYPETLSALRRWRDKAGTAVIPLRRLIWHLAQRQTSEEP